MELLREDKTVFRGSGRELLATAPTEAAAWRMYDKLASEAGSCTEGTRRKWRKLIETSWGPRGSGG